MCERALHLLGVPTLPVGAFQKTTRRLARLYGGKGNSTPAPDPRLVEAQIHSLGVQDEALQSMQRLSEEMSPLQRQQLQQSIEQGQQLWDWNAADRDYTLERRGRLTGIQDKILAEANTYSAEDRRRQLAAQSDSDVAQAFRASRDATMREATRMGVNPNDGRMAAQGAQLAASEALARVQGRRQANDAAHLEGRQLTDRAANTLAGYPTMSTGTVGQGTGTMGAGVSAFQQGLSGMYQPYRDIASAAGNMGSNATSMYGTQANAYNQSQQQGDGFGMLLGLGARALFSDRRLKTGIRLVGRDARTGLNIYEFAFKGERAGRRWRGVMADEVRESYPHAVHRCSCGFDAVDYAALGLAMQAVGTAQTAEAAA